MTDWTANHARVGGHGSLGRWTLRTVGPLLALIVGCWLLPVATAAAAWSIQPTPNQTAGPLAANGLFNSVSCPSAGACTAVGDVLDGNGYQSLATGWNGSAWSLESPVNLPQPLTTLLNGVSCANANACAAVGGALVLTVVPIVELWNGSQWSGAIAGTPTNQGAVAAELSGVSCAAAQECDAVGYTYVLGSSTNPSSLVPLSELWTGGPWGAAPLPTPTGALESSLSGVSCSTSSCTAVGSYTSSTGAIAPLVETTGTSAVDLGSVPTPAKSVSNVFFAVSCSASNACTATGASATATGAISPLAERWNGTTWSVQTTPVPTGASASALLGVSCPSANACTAVGLSVGTDGAAQPLIETWNGATWSVQTAAIPTGSTVNALTAVSCTPADVCTAVGGSLSSGTPAVPLTLAESSSLRGSTLSASRTLADRLPFPAGPLLVAASGAHGRVTRRAVASVLKAKLATARAG